MKRAQSGALLALSLLLGACATPPMEPLYLATPRQERSALVLNYEGRVTATRVTPVSAPITGTVAALDVSPGQRVRAGQVLIRLDTRNTETALRVVETVSANVRTRLTRLEKQRDRQARRPAPTNPTSTAQAMAIQSALATAQAQLDAYDQQADTLRHMLAQHQIVAPEDGVVDRITVALGDAVHPGQAVLTLFDPHSLRVTVAVPALLNARATQGSGVRLELPAQTAAQRWIKPIRVQSLPDPQGAMHQVFWQLDLPAFAGDARPDMLARVWLPQTAETTPGARMFVPATAVTQRLNMTLVYVLDPGGHPLPRPVTVGPANDPSEREVLGGLAPYEQVVLNPRAAEQRLHR